MEASLQRTTSMRSEETLRRLSVGARDVDTGETGGAPVTPSYMQTTKSVKAKARWPSPKAADSANLPERTPPVSSPSAKRRMSQEYVGKPGVPSSPRTLSKVKRPPSPRWLRFLPRKLLALVDHAEYQLIDISEDGSPSHVLGINDLLYSVEWKDGIISVSSAFAGHHQGTKIRSPTDCWRTFCLLSGDGCALRGFETSFQLLKGLYLEGEEDKHTDVSSSDAG